ncbi:MAG: hypothetical protein QG587_1430, partial [Chloroflexota bacterium]|nr:hypothetical protein [Chloroflexota bacterium]
PLARNTLYTVTVRRGLPIAETGMTLEETRVVRFETTGSAVSRAHVTVARSLFDAAPSERAAIGLRIDLEENAAPVKKVDVVVHRLPGLTAAVAAWRRVEAAPDWTVRSGTTPVKTAALPETMEGSVRVNQVEDGWGGWFRLPSRLRAGWYVVTVTHAGIARQTVLQVTNVAAFATVTSTRSLVWVNDLATNRALSGARVTIAGKGVGTTDADGLLVARTPAALLADSEEGVPSVAVVRSRGREMLLPLETGNCWLDCTLASDAWWTLMTLDREQYRTTDTINVWGVVRDRQCGAVPKAVTVTLAASTGSSYTTQPAIARSTLDPNPAGAYVANLSFADLPPGEYQVTTRVGDAEVADRTLLVGPVAKPAWRLALDVPERAVVTGSSVAVNAAASFFEGTPVAGSDLRFSAENEDDSEGANTPIRSTTDAGGRATASVPVRLGGDSEEHGQWSIQSIVVRPSDPEEGDIYADAEVVVFRSTAVLDVTPVLKGRTLTITGSVHAVDFDRYNEDPAASLWGIDPRGVPLAGRRVDIRISEETQVTRQTGTRYDFIAKRTVPVYESSTRTKALPAQAATTGADGSFRLVVTVKGGDRSYTVIGTHVDPAGRKIQAQESAWATESRDDQGARLIGAGADEGWGTYGVGDKVRIRFAHGTSNPEVSRYLFAVLARGLRAVSVQASPSFATRFTSSLVPNAQIRGVRFTGTGYESGGEFGAALRTEDRALDVALTTDRDRYQPGERATVTVTTRTPAGQPTPASVFVRAVDEKLFAMGIANVDDPLGELYGSTDSGLIVTGWSHGGPFVDEGGGKDTMGGGEGGDTTGGGREDFRDWLVAKLVTTGADGRATVSFDLSDDLTSWRVVGSAITTGLQAGVGHVQVPVGLPFFAEVVVAPEYLAVDRPAIRLRAYGSALRAGDPVRFTVTSSTVPLAAVTADSTAFEPVEVELPAMPVGTHRL